MTSEQILSEIREANLTYRSLRANGVWGSGATEVDSNMYFSPKA